MSQLTLAVARDLIAQAMAHAEQNFKKPVCVSVCDATGLLPVLLQDRDQLRGVEGLDIDADIALDPRQHAALDPVDVARKLLDEGRNLPFQHRNQQQHHADDGDGPQQVDVEPKTLSGGGRGNLRHAVLLGRW